MDWLVNNKDVGFLLLNFSIADFFYIQLKNEYILKLLAPKLSLQHYMATVHNQDYREIIGHPVVFTTSILEKNLLQKTKL